MRHRMQPEFAEPNPLHLAIRRMELDPILVAPKTIARMKHRRMLVGNFRQLIKPSSSKLSKTIKMRLHRSAQPRLHVKIEQVAQPAVDAIEVHPAAIGRDEFGGSSIAVQINRCHRKLEVIFSR